MRIATTLALALALPAVLALADDGQVGDGNGPAGAARPRHSGIHGFQRVRHAGRWDITYPADHWRFWWYANRRNLLDEVTHRVEANADVLGAVTPKPPAPGAPLPPPAWRQKARDALREACASKLRSMVTEAALSLGRGGDPRDTELLAGLVSDVKRDPKERERAALGLGLLDVEKGSAAAATARDALVGLARESEGNYDDRLDTWGLAVYALGLRRDPSAMPAVQDLLRKGVKAKDETLHRDVVCSAASALGMFKDEMAAPDLLDIVGQRPGNDGDRRRSMYVSIYAAHGLAKLGAKSALPGLVELVEDEREEVRRAVLLAIGAIAGPGDDAAAAALAKVIRDDHFVSCRECAAISLGRTGHKSAPAVLEKLAADATALERPFAELGLGLFARKTKDPGVKAFLLARLKEPAPSDEQGALATANGLAGNVEAVGPILEMTDGGMPELRGWACYALGLLRVKDKKVIERIHEVVLTQGDPILRREASLALGLLGDRTAVPALREIAEHGKNVLDRGSASVALGRIGSEDAAAALIELVSDKDEHQDLRACAAIGLGFLIDNDEGRRLSQVVSDLDWYTLTEPTDRTVVLVD